LTLWRWHRPTRLCVTYIATTRTIHRTTFITAYYDNLQY